MRFLRALSRASKSATFAIAMAFLAGSSVDAQTTTVVVNDDFANGFSDLSGNGSEMDFFTTSSGAGLNADRTVAGPIDFASGTSGRAIHGLFAPQTLVAVGDSLEVTFEFTTPATIAGSTATFPLDFEEDFRFGLFSTAGAPNGQADFAMNIAASSGTPNTLLNTLAGFEGEIDNLNASSLASALSDLGIRTHNVNATVTDDANLPTGRLMTTTSGWDFIRSGDDDLITLTGNTTYTVRMFVELNDATLATLDVTIELLDAAGTSIDSLTDTLFFSDTVTDPAVPADIEIGVNTLSFDMIGISTTSGAFGVSNVIGDPDNGIDILNVTITANIGPSTALCGDVDLNGMVTFLDIQPFIAILSAGGFQAEADCDMDGMVTFLDIAPFIAALAAP